MWDLLRQWWFYAWIGAALTIGFVIYAAIVARYMRAAAIALGYDVEQSTISVWDRFLLHVDHWRTIILAWLAVSSQIFYYVNASDLATWSALPWASVFNARAAGIITITCTLLIPLSHAMQYAKAAETTPVSPQK